MSQPFVAGRNAFTDFANRNERARKLIAAVVPEFETYTAMSSRAEQLGLEEAANAAPAFSWPKSAKELTPEWLDNEIGRRLASRESDTRLQLLREFAFDANQTAYMLLTERAYDMLDELDAQLQALTAELTAVVEAMGPGIVDAASAIDADRGAEWKAVSIAGAAYDDIRATQKALYKLTLGAFDDLKCGSANPDPEARLYFHQNVDPQQPRMVFPQDRAERLVFCIRGDTGMWCPNPDRINAALGEVPKRNDQREQPRGHRYSNTALSVTNPPIMSDSMMTVKG